LDELEGEVNRLRGALAQTQKNQEEAEEELYHAKAQKQVLEMQLAVNVASPSPSPTAEPSSTIGVNGEDQGVNGNGGSVGGQRPSLESIFVQRASAYEREIGELKRALQQAEEASRSSRLLDWHSDNGGASIDPDAMQRFYSGVEEDKRRLEQLRSQLVTEDSEGQAVDTPRTRMDKEERAEEAQLRTLTRKYLEDEDEDDVDHANEPAGEPSEPDIGASEPGVDSRLIRADLVELSRNIAAKEDLIGQLRLSQEKYSVRFDADVIGRDNSTNARTQTLLPLLDDAGLLRRSASANGGDSRRERG
jgi:hypothetical protein